MISEKNDECVVRVTGFLEFIEEKSDSAIKTENGIVVVGNALPCDGFIKSLEVPARNGVLCDGILGEAFPLRGEDRLFLFRFLPDVRVGVVHHEKERSIAFGLKEWRRALGDIANIASVLPFGAVVEREARFRVHMQLPQDSRPIVRSLEPSGKVFSHLLWSQLETGIGQTNLPRCMGIETRKHRRTRRAAARLRHVGSAIADTACSEFVEVRSFNVRIARSRIAEVPDRQQL